MKVLSLVHENPSPAPPSRVVVLGAAGFVGKASSDALSAAGADVVRMTREDVDLLTEGAGDLLRKTLRAGDALVVISAKAPVKNNDMLIENLRMMAPLCEALAAIPPAHVVYVSSDAVYADNAGPLTESSCAQPASLHGVMHLAREVMLANAFAGPLCILRPTLIYGAADPHNGYGPNRFRRLANSGQDIALFGEGEERRDHVHVADVGEIVARCVLRCSRGVLNIATGTVTSFREIAERANKLAPTPVGIRSQPRVGPPPHNGYRAFDAASTRSVFPDFQYTSLDDGLALSQKEEFDG